MSRYAIMYFTGTGNTERAAQVFAAEVRAAGATATLQRIRRGIMPELSSSDTLVVLFPVYALATPGLVISFLKKLPRVEGARAVVIENHGMISTRGGWDTGYGAGADDQVAAVVRRKGYTVQLTSGVGYPENVTIIASAISDANAAAVIEAADAQVRKIARDAVAGTFRARPHRLAARAVSAVGLFLLHRLGAWQAGKLYVADERCNGCGLCARACPAKALHLWKRGLSKGRPRWNLHCTWCLGCFNLCPVAAVQVSPLRVVLLVAATVFPIVALAKWWPHGVASSAEGGAAGLLSGAFTGALLPLGVLFVILAYAAGFLVLFFASDLLATLVEMIPGLRRVASISWTRRFRRYAAPGFRGGDHE